MNQRQIFLQNMAPTSFSPLALPITHAKGARMYDDEGRQYIDLLGGISVCNVGHCHPKVVAAIKAQADKYLHVMVYGEVIESPQVEYTRLLTDHLPPSLNCVYWVNSGAEAVEGAMKLAKKYTGRPDIVACHHSYHGSTQGALSLLGDESWRQNFRPLLPGIHHVWFNKMESLDAITENTACILLEPIQAEAGVVVPDMAWMQALRRKCDETGTLLIFDEIQTGLGRTGKLFAFEHFNVVPDILLSAKALGGGMPLGAFIADKKLMDCLAHNPVLGHITTFGGHPVSCAAGKAAFEVLYEEHLMEQVPAKEALFHQYLKHPLIEGIHSKGLMIGLKLKSHEVVEKVMASCMIARPQGQEKPYSVFSTWFLFADDVLALLPPLVITEEEIKMACDKILEGLDRIGTAQ